MCSCGWSKDIPPDDPLHFTIAEKMPRCPRWRWWRFWQWNLLEAVPGVEYHRMRTDLVHEIGDRARTSDLTPETAQRLLSRSYACGCQEFWFMSPPAALRCATHMSSAGPCDNAAAPSRWLEALDVLAVDDLRKQHDEETGGAA